MMRNNNAMSPVISVVLVLLIVSSTVATILLWGVPYINVLQSSQNKDNMLNHFTSIAETIEKLTSSITGDHRVNNVDLQSGSIQFKKDDINNRIILSYSLDPNYNFTASDFGSTNCFLAGTKVLMADGSPRNIEDVMIGDFVLSFNERTKEIVKCRVSKIFSHSETEMVKDYYLIINKNMQVTPNHRFYSEGKWLQADDLKIGDKLFSSEQSYIDIYSIEKNYNREATFNLEVEECHNYFVLSSNDNVYVLVHNDDDGITITSPNAGDIWRAGSTKMIRWTYGSSYPEDTTLDIFLVIDDGDPGTPDQEILIKKEVGIAENYYSWVIPANQQEGGYKLKINITSGGTESVPFYSKIFYITPIYNNIVDNVTVYPDDIPGPPYIIHIPIPTQTYSGNEIKEGSFFIEMIEGKTTRLEVYWLSYDNNELTEPYSLSGLICIDLYDDIDFQEGASSFGSIWIFDSSSITYELPKNGDIDKLILEHGGVINSAAGYSNIQRKPFVYEDKNVFSYHVVQTVSSYYSLSGNANYNFRVFSRLYNSDVIKEGSEDVYNLRLQFFGDNNQIWQDYFVNNFDFAVTIDNMLYYTPSSSQSNGVKFSFVYSTILFEIT